MLVAISVRSFPLLCVSVFAFSRRLTGQSRLPRDGRGLSGNTGLVLSAD